MFKETTEFENERFKQKDRLKEKLKKKSKK